MGSRVMTGLRRSLDKGEDHEEEHRPDHGGDLVFGWFRFRGRLCVLRCDGDEMIRDHYATRRAFPWRTLCLYVGAILTIGGGLVAVSTPGLGWVFWYGLLALVAGATE
jgi:hypothetical protein